MKQNPKFATVRKALAVVLVAMLPMSVSFAAEEQTPEPAETKTEVVESDPVLLEIEREVARVDLKKEKLGLWLAWIMPFTGMGFTLAILAIIFGYSRKADQNRHDTIRMFLEKGIEVPERLLIDPENPTPGKRMSDVRKGVIWTVIGLGLAGVFFIGSGGNWRACSMGLLPLLIGVGYFIVGRLDPKPTTSDE